ncbi:MAG: hypothetical protein ACFHWZ_17270 [Phycisphaerales bacterium]
MDPKTRQSADHSMAYIVSTKLRKALELAKANGSLDTTGGSHDAVWKALMLSPYDYKVDDTAIFNDLTRSLMAKIKFVHGGPEFDRNYPDGIPTSIKITDDQGKTHDSGMVMYPAGHAQPAPTSRASSTTNSAFSARSPSARTRSSPPSTNSRTSASRTRTRCSRSTTSRSSIAAASSKPRHSMPTNKGVPVGTPFSIAVIRDGLSDDDAGRYRTGRRRPSPRRWAAG